MTVIEALRTELAANPAFTALVSSRVYPLMMPQGVTLPAVVMTMVSAVPTNTLAGSSVDRIISFTVQVDCYAKNYLQAHQIADALDLVVSALQRPDLSAELDLTRDIYDDSAELYRVSCDYIVWM